MQLAPPRDPEHVGVGEQRVARAKVAVDIGGRDDAHTRMPREIVPRDEQTPAALAALQKAEIAKWWPIVKDAGIKAE